jgi:hypothetical protein
MNRPVPHRILRLLFAPGLVLVPSVALAEEPAQPEVNPSEPPAPAAVERTDTEDAAAAAAAAAGPGQATTSAPTGPVTTAVVRFYANYPGAWLETRSAVEPEPWQRACAAPCNVPVETDGKEVRVVAPGMSDSNAFRIEPGFGVAHIRVKGGSATARELGTWGLLLGLPVALIGGGFFSYGMSAKEPTATTGGAIVLSLGAVTVLASLPALLMGSTTVRDGRGGFIARMDSGLAF